MAAVSRKENGASPVALAVNEDHTLHNYREPGYTETPKRIESILTQLRRSGLFREVSGRRFPDVHLKAVHGAEFLSYLKRACASVPEGRFVCADTFPTGGLVRPPRSLLLQAGCYCLDSFTPLGPGCYAAARGAVDSALTAAEAVRKGARLAYALVRPPGHHAERHCFGGYCYLNNTAVAAHYLSHRGKVAIVDLDYHHGNGQQDIFYRRDDVLTVSLHGRPDVAYPYFSGYEDERGAGPGEGFNLNLPLPARVDGRQYRRALAKAIRAVAGFQPAFLVAALGLDTAQGDPCGTWTLDCEDFRNSGEMLGQLRLPTLVVQEGGYRLRTLGAHARCFFEGLLHGDG